jgi:apolipoprotein D and lipocalin family protein
MKKHILFLSAAILSLGFSSTSYSQISTVPYVDVSQYLGTWYQISHNPLAFEGECACSQQKLAATGVPGEVSVFNSCNDKTPAGPIRSISGTATSDDPVSNSKFSVDFGFPRKGEYWIIGLASDYKYAVVTDSRGDSLYILSKTPSLDPVLYQEALDLAQKQVDLSKLELTNQTGCTYP